MVGTALVLRLARLPESIWAKRGCYPNPSGVDLPARMRFLHPDAARALTEFEDSYPGLLYFSDVYRHPLVSLAAIQRDKAGHQRRRGALPPGYSGHNWGLSFDVHLGRVCVRISYRELRKRLEAFGWYCHRRDYEKGEMEAWHFNFLGERPGAADLIKLADPSHPSTWSHPLEQRIVRMYGSQISVLGDDLRARLALADCKEPDWIDAVRSFQRKWGLVEDGVVGMRTLRTLAIVTARNQVSELA